MLFLWRCAVFFHHIILFWETDFYFLFFFCKNLAGLWCHFLFKKAAFSPPYLKAPNMRNLEEWYHMYEAASACRKLLKCFMWLCYHYVWKNLFNSKINSADTSGSKKPTDLSHQALKLYNFILESKWLFLQNVHSYSRKFPFSLHEIGLSHSWAWKWCDLTSLSQFGSIKIIGLSSIYFLDWYMLQIHGWKVYYYVKFSQLFR